MTARRASEQAWHEDAEQLRASFELAAVGMAQAEPRTGRLLRVNQALCALTGYSAEELLARSFLELTHPEDREADFARFRAMVRGETDTYTSEKRYVRKDGRLVWVLVTARLIRDGSGEPLRTAAIIQDVTERRWAAEALRESEARLRGLLDSTAEGIWGVDLEGRCTFANRTCLRLLGYERVEELVGQSMHALTHHSRRDGRPYAHEDCPIHQAFHSGQGTDVTDELFFRKDGSCFPVHYRSSPLLQQGRVAGAVVTFRDITEQARVEAERARTLALLHTLADNAAEALYLMDAQGRTALMNPAAERMFGWSREESLGRVLHELVHHTRPDGSPFPMEECPLGAVMHSGQAALAQEDVFIHKDGRRIPVSCSNAPVIVDGRITGAVLVVHDLTEQRRGEQQERARRDFEQQLVGIVSHDLRSPLSAILMSAQALMRREDTDARLFTSLARIASSGERALRLIRDLLDFTQVRLGGGIPVQRRAVDLGEVARQAMEEVRQAHPHRDLSFQASGDSAGEWDPDRLAQLLTNLVVNAVTYSPEDALVSVRTRGEAEHVLLEVHNEGQPIPGELLPYLFEPFRRGREGAATPVGNIGLGLFIVNHLVRAHGGGIAVRSTAAEGTTFCVRLPRRPPPCAA